MRFKLKCRLCGETFRWVGDEFPDECQVCFQYIGNDGKPEVAAPYIALGAAKNGDNVYKAMEKGAEHRINVAAENLGIDRSELSDMKMTNMQDNAREGESTEPKLTSKQNEIMNWAATQQPQNVEPKHFGADPVAERLKQSPEALRRDPMVHKELGHPKSGAGTGLGTLNSLRASRFG